MTSKGLLGLVVLVVTAGAAGAGGDGLSASAPAPPPAPSPAVSLAASLTAELAPRVGMLTRRVDTYHYTTREQARLEPAEGGAAGRPVESYLREKAGLYWDERYEPSPGHPIWGLYLAVDPVASRVFGGSGGDWALVRLTLPRGLRFLDVRTEGGLRRLQDALPPATRERLAAAGCNATFAFDLLIDRGPLSCRELALSTLLELDVDAILYDFKAVDFTECGDPRQGAFLLLRAEAVDPAEARVFFDREASPEAEPERRRIRELFDRARSSGSTRQPIWPDLDGLEPSAETTDWMRRSLFACGDRLAERPDVETPAVEDRIAEALRRGIEGQRAGDTAGAAAAWEELLALDPDRVEALYALAWMRAASPQPGLRNAERAVELAEWLVEVTHYMQRRSTVGWDWPKHFKVKASFTVAVAYAAAGRWERAVAYADQALETAGAQHRHAGTPQSARVVAQAEALLERFRGRRPYVGPPPGPGFAP